ncbi:MAG: hypothetical protein LAQ30_04680 [Acidobacteriia bacterium]|nr:hypothetical protein [Terriglobia bacterium]
MKSVLLLLLGAWFSSISVTEYVDGLEPLLTTNRDVYLSGPRTPEKQRAALEYFDQQWAWLRSPQGCGSRLLGSAGAACLADRSRDGRWPWEVYYRDPIVNGHF